MKKIILILLTTMLTFCNICSYASAEEDNGTRENVNIWEEENIGFGQYGNIWVFLVRKGTNVKGMLAMNTPENGGPRLDGEGVLLMSMRSLCGSLRYTIASKDNGDVYISNGVRNIIIPADTQAAYVDGEKNAFEYSIINNVMYFPYKYIDTLFDIAVDWDSETNSLTLTERESTPVSDSEMEYRKKVTTLYVDSSNDTPSLTLDNVEISFDDVEPFIDENGRTQVPVRAVAEMLNCNVDWNETTQTVTVADVDKLIVLTIGSNIINIAGIDTEMDTSAIIKNDRTYIPIRYVAEALGLDVIWRG